MTRVLLQAISLMVVFTSIAGPLLAGPRSSAPGAVVSALVWGSAADLGLGALELLGLVVFGITIRKSTADLANKLVTRAQAATGDYRDGVANAGADWEANTKASEGNYEAGVQEAINKKRFGRGVANAGAGKYQKNATELGSTRYGPGISNAKEAWVRGVQPALDVLKGLQLPPKGPKRSPQNQQRAAAVALALGALKDRS